MTIKEIAEKYGISYNIAYQGTYGVKPVSGEIRDREYQEEPVVENVKKILHGRIVKGLEKVSELQDMLERVCERAE